ncbi:hypothetical protein HPP92_024092 [Vanilla planifolia]|uniref:Uncharacterized protein n=1 Tax=Vanilla planifolia TaxID=51239 RepID=A0A835PMW9_VANPL|nr:hypothetical protein HPP92_024092 [Vanilla planifolia]
MNPARSLGPAIVTNNFNKIWIYLISPVIGWEGQFGFSRSIPWKRWDYHADYHYVFRERLKKLAIGPKATGYLGDVDISVVSSTAYFPITFSRLYSPL